MPTRSWGDGLNMVSIGSSCLMYNHSLLRQWQENITVNKGLNGLTKFKGKGSNIRHVSPLRQRALFQNTFYPQRFLYEHSMALGVNFTLSRLNASAIYGTQSLPHVETGYGGRYVPICAAGRGQTANTGLLSADPFDPKYQH